MPGHEPDRKAFRSRSRRSVAVVTEGPQALRSWKLRVGPCPTSEEASSL